MTEPLADMVELRIPPDPKYIAVVRLTVAGVASRAGMSVDDVDDLKVAVCETYTNVIDHAFEGVRPRPVLIRMTATDRELQIEVIDEGVPAGKCSIKVPGDHNVLNALAVIALLKTLGIPVSDLLPVMAGFKGVGRRLEIRGRYGDILFIDDYAHHPSEIRASAQALRMSYASGGRLVILFQPHRYSRVRDCFAEFARCFEAADCVIVTDIYAASEEPIPGVDALSLCERIREQVPEVVYVPHELIMSRVPVLLQPGDCVCAMGAGDISALLTAVIGKIAVADQV